MKASDKEASLLLLTDAEFAEEDDSYDVTDGNVGVIDGGTSMGDEESSDDIETIEGDE